MVERISKEEIAKRIRNNIKMKRIMCASDIDGQNKNNVSTPVFERADLNRDYKLINENWRVDINDISVESDKPLISVAVKIVKRAVRKLTYWLYNPLFNRVTEHNAGVTRILNEQARQTEFFLSMFEKLNERIDEQVQQNSMQIESILNEVETLSRQETQRSEQLDSLLQTIGRVEQDLRQIDALSRANNDKLVTELYQLKQYFYKLKSKVDKNKNNIEEVKKSVDMQVDIPEELGFDYVAFEDKFRGRRDDIKARQSVYLEFVLSAYLSIGDGFVLDVGPGRGEFLELCREQNVPARGIDINAKCVNVCREMGLVCEYGDALDYLISLEDESLVGVTAFQVIEHLGTKGMIDLIQVSYQKLKPGGVIVLETVNPKTLASLRNFYIDLTHNRPVMPETLKFLFESNGFKSVEIKYYSCVPEEHQLTGDDKNIEKLNNMLFGFQDYAVVGWK